MRNILPVLIFLAMTGILPAQDFHLSQYDAAPLNLNPSMTGMFDGYYRIHGHYRTQWASIATKPFVTTQIAYDMPFKRFGFGAEIMNYRAGAGGYNVLNFLISAAYDKPLDKKNNHHLAFGLQTGFVQKSFNSDKLTFGSQFDPTNGGGFDTGLPNNELLINKGIFMPDFNIGATYYYCKNQSRLNPYIGFSSFHLTQPKETFYNYENQLKIRYLVHGGCKININEEIQLEPKFFYMKQINDREFTWGGMGYYFLKASSAFFMVGATVRDRDALIFETGFQKDRYTYRIGYDINTSSLQPVTNGKGGLEVSITYLATREKFKPKPVPNCPRL